MDAESCQRHGGKNRKEKITTGKPNETSHNFITLFLRIDRFRSAV